jgi:sugar lactone lactonase YvrE
VTTLQSGAAILALAALAAAPGAARPASLTHRLTISMDDKEEPLRAPEGVACSDKGAVVVADTGNGRLLTYTWRDGRLGGGVPVKLAEASYPASVQIDSRGNVLVLDRRTRRIVKVDVAGKFAGSVDLRVSSGPPSVVPAAFKLDASDNLYVLDQVARRVVVAGPDGIVSREVPLPRGGEEFTDVAVDGAGRILALDSVGARLWAATKEAAAFKAIGESLKDRVSFPVYVAESQGKLYLSDQHGHGLVVLGADGRFVGRELEMGWTSGKVYYPAQLCVSGEGQVFVADRGNNRVQVFSEAR